MSCVENLAQNWASWPLRTCEGYEIWQNPEIWSRCLNLAQMRFCGRILAKSRNFQSCLKFGSKLIFWPLWTWEGWNLAKSKHFESHWKFGSKLLFWLLKDLQRMKFGKIQKFWVVLKIWLKTYIFDHSGHARMKFGKIQKFSIAIKINPKLIVLTTLDMQK